MNNPILNLRSHNLTYIIELTLLAIILPFRSVSSAGITKNSIIDLANKNREQAVVATLSENNQLAAAAELKAQDMLNSDYFDHYSPAGKAPWDFILAQKYDYSIAGENLAMDFDTSEGVTRAWMDSPTHAKNILNPLFTDIGVAVIDGKINGSETTLVVQMFGSKQESVINSILNMPVVKTVSIILGIK